MQSRRPHIPPAGCVAWSKSLPLSEMELLHPHRNPEGEPGRSKERLHATQPGTGLGTKYVLSDLLSILPEGEGKFVPNDKTVTEFCHPSTFTILLVTTS